jgi:hypothetical protein
MVQEYIRDFRARMGEPSTGIFVDLDRSGFPRARVDPQLLWCM